MKLILSTLIFVGLTSAPAAYAESPQSPETAPIESFQSVIQIPPVNVLVPTVVAVPLDNWVAPSTQFLVRERETGKYIGSSLPFQTMVEIQLQAHKVPPDGTGSFLIDQSPDTYANFAVSDEGPDEAHIVVEAVEPITTSRLYLQLAEYVALPITVEIKAKELNSSVYQTVVAKKKVTSTSITFPEVTSDKFEIKFTYAQPLRISELNFSQILDNETEQILRFLAQPNSSYEIYFSPDRPVSVRATESGNLHLDEGVLQLPRYQSTSNVRYVPADIDADGIRDTLDNCVRVANQNQIDIDRNGRGDACDDFDRDGRINSIDNCVNLPNVNQADEDGDGIGNACDKEESRFTESNPWVPWVGMGTAAAVLIILFMLVAKGAKPEDEASSPDSSEGNKSPE